MLYQFPLNLCYLLSEVNAPFHWTAFGYSYTDWKGLPEDIKDVLWEDIFKLGASAAVFKFCYWIKVGIDVYVSHCKY